MHELKKRDRIIASIKKWWTSYLKRSNKFSRELPKTMEEAYALDAKNGNTLWADATSKEMENVRVAFEVLPDGKSVPTSHQFVWCHMVFDVKMEVFRYKAKLVAWGHMTLAPTTIMFVSIVSRERVGIVLMIATLNDLEVKALIVRALYSLKLARAAFRSHLARCMESLGYQSWKVDLFVA